MKRIIHILVIITVFVCALYSETGFKAVSDIKGSIDEAKGITAVKIEVLNTSISGQKDKNIRLICFIGKDKWLPELSHTIFYKCKEDPQNIKKLVFEIPQAKIEKVFGKGKHNFNIGFGAYGMEDGASAIPGSWSTKSVKLSIGEKPYLNSNPVIAKPKSQKYRFVYEWSLQNTGMDLSKVVVIMPVPQSNSYQNVSSIDTNGGQLLTMTSGTSIKKNRDQYVRFTLNSDAPKPGKKIIKNITAEVELFEINTDLGLNYNPPAYKKDADFYRQYTNSRLPFIEPGNSLLSSVADKLWAESDGNILTYSKKAYLYTAQGFTYQNAYTGIHPMSEIISQNGGDCGNLSSIFISLLRARGIPAHHLIGVNTKGKFHAYSEFYLEGTGWIPVDVTYKNSDPRGDYFGKVSLKSQLMIVSNDVNITVEREPGQMVTEPLLQSFLWWAWGKGDFNKLKPNLKVSVQNEEDVKKARERLQK